jgi:hypothetical protein
MTENDQNGERGPQAPSEVSDARGRVENLLRPGQVERMFLPMELGTLSTEINIQYRDENPWMTVNCDFKNPRQPIATEGLYKNLYISFSFEGGREPITLPLPFRTEGHSYWAVFNTKDLGFDPTKTKFNYIIHP